MADEEDPWAFDDAADSEPVPDQTPSDSKIVVAIDNQTEKEVHEEQVDESILSPPLPEEDDGYRKPVQLYRHWVRPKFLQYRYMYNYRTNYYDDVIDYLDKKQVGVTREIPRPQTWAERVLRANHISGTNLDSYSSTDKRDKHLIQTLAASIRTHNYHTKAYINQKYANVL